MGSALAALLAGSMSLVSKVVPDSVLSLPPIPTRPRILAAADSEHGEDASVLAAESSFFTASLDEDVEGARVGCAAVDVGDAAEGGRAMLVILPAAPAGRRGKWSPLRRRPNSGSRPRSLGRRRGGWRGGRSAQRKEPPMRPISCLGNRFRLSDRLESFR